MGKYYQAFKTEPPTETKTRRFMKLKISIIIVLMVAGALLLAQHQAQVSGWQNALSETLR